MKVFKFGGASVKDAPAIENLKNILQRYENEQLVVVISAMGKTTNFMEKMLDAYYHAPENVPALLSELRTQHESVAEQLMGADNPFLPHSERIFTLQDVFQIFNGWGVLHGGAAEFEHFHRRLFVF